MGLLEPPSETSCWARWWTLASRRPLSSPHTSTAVHFHSSGNGVKLFSSVLALFPSVCNPSMSWCVGIEFLLAQRQSQFSLTLLCFECWFFFFFTYCSVPRDIVAFLIKYSCILYANFILTPVCWDCVSQTFGCFMPPVTLQVLLRTPLHHRLLLCSYFCTDKQNGT